MTNITGFTWDKKTRSYIDLYELLDKKYHVYTAAACSLIKLTKIKKEDKVLDLGCGTGILTKQLANLINPENLYCLDISSSMLKRTKEKCNLKVNFIEADFTKPWSIKQKFDCIISSFTYYYLLNNLDVALNEIYPHLKPKGKFAFNITSYLSEINIGRQKANEFFQDIFNRLDKYLRLKGYKKGRGEMIAAELLRSSEAIKMRLLKTGFKNIQFRFSSLPINPYEAFQYTIEGFYSQGSKPVISSTLYHLPLKTRLKLITDFVEQNKKYLSSLPKVKIIEVRADK